MPACFSSRRSIAPPVTRRRPSQWQPGQDDLSLPAPPNSGIRFRRVDLEGKPEIEARVENVVENNRSTTLAKGNTRIHTVEHVLATFAGFGIDNAVIELDANEPPIADGSAREYCKMVESAGIVAQEERREPYAITTPIELEMGDRRVPRFSGVKSSKAATGNRPSLSGWCMKLEDFVGEKGHDGSPISSSIGVVIAYGSRRSSWATIPADSPFLQYSRALPSAMGGSLASSSMTALSIPNPAKVARTCSTVWIRVFPLARVVERLFFDDVFDPGFNFRFPFRSTRRKRMPEFGGAGRKVILTRLPL